MKNFFCQICLFSQNYVEDIQALGRDRDFFEKTGDIPTQESSQIIEEPEENSQNNLFESLIVIKKNKNFV
jgi:hypothetical protein